MTTFRIAAEWCREQGPDITGMPDPMEDEATLAEISIEIGETAFSQVVDLETRQVQNGANLSAYRLAEWLTWNWWRLRWEPAHQNFQRDRSTGWRQAHELAGIGGGWLWPNVTIKSDGFRVVLDARPSQETRAEPLRYIADQTSVIPVDTFEAGVDDLVGRVLERLGEWSAPSNDLCTAWEELSAERNDPESTLYRKIEACLGFDVDEADPGQVEQVIADGDTLGRAAMTEVVADRFLTAHVFQETARGRSGFDIAPGDRAETLANSRNGFRDRAPWEIGAGAANTLRRREGLGDNPVSDRRLAALYGVEERALADGIANGEMAFALHEGDRGSRAVLRSKWKTGRRFEVARLLADSLLVPTEDRLRPATGAYTYRQKMQRAFAAELLCPVESLVRFLEEDFSEDAREEAAERFGVSPLAVTSVLVNHGFVNRGEAEDPEVQATA